MSLKVKRRGSAVFCNSRNELQLVEVNVLGEWGGKGAGGPHIMAFDAPEAERIGKLRLEQERPGEHWDYVGTLFAETGAAQSRGRINWGADFERMEVIA